MKIKPKDILLPTVTLFVICVIVSVLLAGTNALTKEPIAENTKHKTQNAMYGVCPRAVSFEESETDSNAYLAFNAEGEKIGCAVSVTAKGYGGDVTVMVGICGNKDTQAQVTGVEILSHDETPGLGANAEKEDFRTQYKQELSAEGFSVVKDGSGGSQGKVDAITGATVTSKAVTSAVNDAAEIYGLLVKGGEL